MELSRSEGGGCNTPGQRYGEGEKKEGQNSLWTVGPQVETPVNACGERKRGDCGKGRPIKTYVNDNVS